MVARGLSRRAAKKEAERKGEAEEIRQHALAVSLYLMVLYGRSDKGTRLLADVKHLLPEIMLPGAW